MMIKSVLTSALLALSLGSEAVAASQHGRFAERAREPLVKAKLAVEATNKKQEKQDHKNFRFLSQNTQRE